jgi:endonuclease/exonuclease/phosphatase family metal-dependent hydrolase
VAGSALGLAVSASLISAAGCAATDDDVQEPEVCSGQCDNSRLNLAPNSTPDFLSFSELQAVSAYRGHRLGDRYVLDDLAPGAQAPAADKQALEDKLNRLFDGALINNDAWLRTGTTPKPQHQDDRLSGAALKVVEWNIERGQQLPAILQVLRAARDDGEMGTLVGMQQQLVADDDYTGDNAKNFGFRPEYVTDDVKNKIRSLKDADIIVLNEVDIGVKRSDYANVVKSIADLLGMNYAWNPEFLEIDPLMLVTADHPYFTADHFMNKDRTQAQAQAMADDMNRRLAVDPSQAPVFGPDNKPAMNVIGNAILSRYPILKADRYAYPIQFGTTQAERDAHEGEIAWIKTQFNDDRCWEWNHNEWQPRQLITQGADLVAEKLFLEEMKREVRHGSRTSMVIDVMVPGVNAKGTALDGQERDNVVTVMTAHIENKGSPSCRRGQLKEVLKHIEGRNNPVIFTGDFNTLGTDGRPTTIQSLLRSKLANPEWLARQVLTRFNPYAGYFFTAYDIFKWFKTKDDPTSFFSPEHNFFNIVRDDQSFPDGARFDWRGDSKHSGAGGHTLANSNARDGKGFVTTSAFERPLMVGPLTLIGKYPIDWIFVRSYMTGDNPSYKLAPHFPQTLEDVRDATLPRLADHAPKTVLLPLNDPGCGDACTTADPGDDIPEVSITDPSVVVPTAAPTDTQPQ